MTNADIFAQILCEASGRPLEACRSLAEQFAAGQGSGVGFNAEVPETEAAALLASLRSELPGIRAWLAEGNRLMLLDLENARRH